MKLLNKLERKLGRYAIPNLMKYVVVLFIVGLFFGSFMPGIYNYLALDFNLVMKGQVWRLITFIVPYSHISGIFFFAISTYFFYIIGNSLEQNWGAFRLNLYFFSGVFFNIIASLIMFLITGSSVSSVDSLSLICSTMFFAFAALYPNVAFYVYFLIPVKAKYLALLEGAVYIYYIYNYIVSHEYFLIIPLVVAFANFLIFFFATRNYHRISPSELRRKATYRRQMSDARNTGNVTQFRGKNVITRHKCAVCSRI